MKITLSLNDKIAGRLTEAGERAWAKYWSETEPRGVPDVVREAATMPDGRVRFHIWEAMHIFGPACYMGVAQGPFEANAIEVVPEQQP